jgi:hypothetical protein
MTMTMPDHDHPRRSPPTSGRASTAHYVGRSYLALLGELENSLQSSQAAWLARDVAGTERCTREQLRLCRALQALVRRWFAPAATQPASESGPGLSEAGLSEAGLRARAPELADQLLAAALRVQRGARVQAALLRRKRRFLCVLANWMAGAEAGYGPPAAPTVALREPAEVREGSERREKWRV